VKICDNQSTFGEVTGDIVLAPQCRSTGSMLASNTMLQSQNDMFTHVMFVRGSRDRQ